VFSVVISTNPDVVSFQGYSIDEWVNWRVSHGKSSCR